MPSRVLARDQAVGRALLQHHVAEVDRVPHQLAGIVEGDAVAPAGAGENLGIDLGVAADRRVDDLDCVSWHLVLDEEVVDGVGRTEQNWLADALVGEDLGGAHDLVRLALGEDDPFGIGHRLVEDTVHDLPGARQPILELPNIVVPGREGFTGDAGADRRLGHRGRLPQQHPVVERLRNQIVAAELDRFTTIGPDHRVRHVLLGQIGQRAGGRQLHLLVDAGGGHVKRAAKDEGKAEHVVDLVGIVPSS